MKRWGGSGAAPLLFWILDFGFWILDFMHYTSGGDLWQWRRGALGAARSAAIPPLELDWLLLALTDLDRLALQLETFQQTPQIPLKVPFETLQTLWQQRLEQRVPVQYLAGSLPWRQFELQVSPAVLIPRPETELLIDLALAAAQTNPALAPGPWADLGTGSGAIAIGLAAAFPTATLHAVDVSEAALAVARQNAERCGVADRIAFYQGSWMAPIAHLRHTLQGLISNPPYIPSHEVLTLQPEVTRHEPHLALDGGPDGLDCLRHLVQIGAELLVPGGVWMVEMMAGQGPAMTQLLNQNGAYQNVRIVNDLAGLERFAVADRR
jgi:release factor glutamine methyltransferase